MRRTAAVTGIALFCAAHGQAAARGGHQRAVQVITMGPGTQAQPAGQDAGKQQPESGADSFQMLELGRTWVEQQLASFANAASPVFRSVPAEEPVRASPVSSRTDPLRSDSASIAPISAIAVPAWMRLTTPFPAPAPVATSCDPRGYAPSGLLDAAGEGRRQAFYGMMSSIACDYGIPVGLFDAMIIQESRYQPTIYSPKLAYGLTQLMPATARSLGVNRYDPVENMRGGALYLRNQLDRFGQAHLALAAYNAGPGRVRNGLVPSIAETQAYVRAIVANWSRLTLAPRLGRPSDRPRRSVEIAAF